MKPAPMPWILCGPGGPPDSTALSSGSTATILRPGLRGFSTEPTPVSVPPVPTPLTTTSTLPPVSRQISSAVVRRWISGLAGFWNCCGMKASGSERDHLLGAGDGAAHALRRRRQLELRAQELQHPAALHRHAVGHGEDEAIALGRGDEGERDAGIARGRLDQHGLARA